MVEWGYIYWGCDRYALQHFKGCHDRVRDGKAPSIKWPRNREGYLAFCQALGPIPIGMKKPSVGRINHKKGYAPGNVRWEEYAVNSVKRRGTKYERSTAQEIRFYEPSFRRGSQEHKEHQRIVSLRRWSDPKQRKAMSERMKGNQYAKGNPGNRIDR